MFLDLTMGSFIQCPCQSLSGANLVKYGIVNSFDMIVVSVNVEDVPASQRCQLVKANMVLLLVLMYYR